MLNNPRHTSQEPLRSYDRSWDEIEHMLNEAIRVQNGWIDTFFQAKKIGNKDTMKEAARNKKALEGVIKTLMWTLGEEGVEHPLY